jgi:hypothetical protein
VVLPGDWLVSSIWFLLSAGKLHLGPEVTHYQLVQGVRSCCCFHQAAAVFLYFFKSVWLDPPTGRWGN